MTREDATTVYLALIRMPLPSRELLLAQGLPSARLDPALTTLAERGLVVLGEGGAIDVPSPAQAVALHAARLERDARAARASAESLARVYRDARASGSPDDGSVEVLRDLAAVGRATNEAVARASRTVRMLRGMTTRTRQVLDAPMASHREPSVGAGGRAVDMRTIWDSAVLELPAILPVMAARRGGGETQRFLPLVPLSILVVDDHTCVVEWTGDDGGGGSGSGSSSGSSEAGEAGAHRDGAQGLLGTARGAVSAGRAIFERFWQLATPLDAAQRAGELRELDQLDERDAMVLRLMAAGVADASIARQTGISLRTVERRVRYVMDRLGAQTRFHAGVQAARRGWI